VIIVDLAVAVNDRQGLEGAGVVYVLAGRLVFVFFAEQGVAVPGKEGGLAVNGLGAPAALNVIVKYVFAGSKSLAQPLPQRCARVTGGNCEKFISTF
jgi:hypothetical protein